MLANYTHLHIVYENCDRSIIPYEKVRYLSFDDVSKNIQLKGWNMPGSIPDNTIEMYNCFKSGVIVLTPESGEIVTEFAKETGKHITTAERVKAGDITQLHFLDRNAEQSSSLILSLFVDYQEEKNAPLGSPNINQEVLTDPNGDIRILIHESAPEQYVEVKYHNDAARPIKQAHAGEWCDLRAAEDVEMKKGDFKLISLGVSIKAPKNHELMMLPRSSTFKNYGITLTNSMGVIDQLYCGDDDIWYFPALAHRDTTIAAGSRIAQFQVKKNQGKLVIREVESMNAENRGGLGSTGTL